MKNPFSFSAAATPEKNLSTNGSANGDSCCFSVPVFSTYTTFVSRRYQHLLDKSSPHVLMRWTALSILALFFIMRVFTAHGFYLLCYMVACHLLRLLFYFLSPLTDPETIDHGDEPILPTKSTDEYRPFVRKLPEFKFWHSMTIALCIASVLTFCGTFDLPIQWPLLVCYWFIAFVHSMGDRLAHMVRHKYVPFSTGKQLYGKRAASMAT